MDSFIYKVEDEKGLSSNNGNVLIQVVTSDSFANNPADAPEEDRTTTTRDQNISRQISSEPSVIKDKSDSNKQDGHANLQSHNLKLINHSPLAKAGPDRTVYEGTKDVTLKGYAKDIDLDSLIYSWEQIGGDPVIFSDMKTLGPTFNAPDVNEDKVLTFKLTVVDGRGGQGNDYVKITIRDRTTANNAFIYDESLARLTQNSTLTQSTLSPSIK